MLEKIIRYLKKKLEQSDTLLLITFLKVDYDVDSILFHGQRAKYAVGHTLTYKQTFMYHRKFVSDLFFSNSRFH